MTAYYNENDPYAAQWLRNLISRGLVSPGDVDERSISDVSPSDLAGYVQCHFFAGIGVWSHALRNAGVPDDREVWTGSCPCQPFSAAGKGIGFDDERHLWPHWHHLIRVRRPSTVFGEQVASKDGLGWLDLVHSDLEGLGYACGPVPFPAAGIGAPHIRQRLYFVAYADGQPRRLSEHAGWSDGLETAGSCEARELANPSDGGHGDFGHGETGRREPFGDSAARGMDNPERDGRRESGNHNAEHERQQLAPTIATRELGYADYAGSQGRWIDRNGADECATRSAGVAGFWAGADWIDCTDGKARPVEPGTFPLAHGAPARVGRLRAYGNAIVAAQATEFIKAAAASFN